jgi:hypothetical protein
MDEAPFASPLAGSIVNRLTNTAAVRRRSMMLRPMENQGPNRHESRTEALSPGTGNGPSGQNQMPQARLRAPRTRAQARRQPIGRR